MARPKVTVVGAGNVGATTAQYIVERELADVVLIDVVGGPAAGQGARSRSRRGRSTATTAGSRAPTTTSETAESDIVVITAGLARKPGMSRDDLLMKNAEIVGGGGEPR